VICVDINQGKINKIREAVSPICEKGLDELLKRNINVNLYATTDLKKAVLETDLTLVAVGTPFNGSEIDLTFVKEASYQIGESLKEKSGYHLVVIKSTVIPGTTDGVVLPVLEEASEKKAGIDFGLGVNPEFLREGEAIEDFMFPDRIVMGGIDQRSLNLLDELYSVFNGVDKIRTNNRTAEMIKYTANSLLATMISFSNEIGNLCAVIGNVDITEVMKGVHLDRRLTPIMDNGTRIVPQFTSYLEAGCGFGGSCFPKDVKALIAQGKKLGRPMKILDAVIRVNEQQPKQVISLLRKHFRSLKGIRVAVLGLAFKPGTDDIRESPAIPIIMDLLAKGTEIKAYDPVIKEGARTFFNNNRIVFCDNLECTIEDVHAVVLLTRWKEFTEIPRLLARLDKQPLFIDGRRMLDKNTISRYEGIGM
jgi:UDPglucose 6-dehydrogenase/GDP-mannose 6-dehydrogenase